MNTFIIRKYHIVGETRVLVSLVELLGMLPLLKMSHWAFRDMYLVHPRTFGIDVPAFEALSTELELGLIVTSSEFETFLKQDFQIYDGCFDGYEDGIKQGVEPIVTICCFDSTQW